MRQAHVARQNKNRQQLLKQMRTMWIEGVLEPSLHQAAELALDVQEQPAALAHPWHLESQETNQPPHPLPAGTPIVQVYDEADGSFLILGEPGAGKTTLLLDLARTLLERAEADKHQPLPVVFPLSSWARKRQPLSDWLVEELWSMYQVPRKVGKDWIAANQVLPLLDGLDEVAEDARPACVRAINAYLERQHEKGATPLVVCSRSQEYGALPTRVNLHQAVSIQPLTEEQLEGYVQSAKGQLEGLRQALHNDPVLSELAHCPLMLNIMTLAYQGARSEELPTGTTREAYQRQIFASYVERMLRGRGISKHASGEDMLRWLRFLATQMQQQHQTVFFLEQLQPDWLAAQHKQLYQQSVGLLGGLFFGLFFGPFFGLREGLRYGLVRGLSVGLVYGLLGGLFFGLFFGLSVGRYGGRRRGLSINQLEERLRLRPRRSARNGLFFGLFFRLVVALFLGLLGGLGYGLLGGLGYGLLGGLFFGLFFGLSVGLGYGLRGGQVFALRLGLWRAGSLPWNVVAFLDEAAARHLLRKVGRGYIFMHRLFLDYFAA